MQGLDAALQQLHLRIPPSPKRKSFLLCFTSLHTLKFWFFLRIASCEMTALGFADSAGEGCGAPQDPKICISVPCVAGRSGGVKESKVQACQ